MNKNIYDLINLTKTDLKDYERQELTELEEERMKQFVKDNMGKKTAGKHRKIKNTAVAAAAVAILMVGSISGVSAVAMQNPTAYQIANFLGIEKNLDSYQTIVNQSVTKNNVTLEIKEVILNQDELLVSVVSSSPEYTSDQFFGPGGTVYINGEEINKGAMWAVKEIDEHTIQSVIQFPLEKVYEGTLDIKLVLSTPLTGSVMSRSPHWTFEFRASGDELLSNTFTHPIEKTFILPNGTNLLLTNFWENDISCSIGYSMDKSLEQQYVTIVGTDEDGNKVEFTLHGVITEVGKFVLPEDELAIVQNAKTLSLSVMFDGNQVGESFTVKL